MVNPQAGLPPEAIEQKLLLDRIFQPWLNPANAPDGVLYDQRADLLLALPETSTTPAPSRNALVRGDDLLTLAPPQHWERTCGHCWQHKPAATFGSDGLCRDCTGEVA